MTGRAMARPKEFSASPMRGNHFIIYTMPYQNALRSDADMIVYLDIKSPYAYLAKDPTRKMAEEFRLHVEWRPLTLNIPSFLGSARTDNKGKVVESKRSPRQWQSVRYAYMDAKRYARLRDVLIYGTQKIWDTTLASIAMTYTATAGQHVQDRYLDLVYERFWKRELDVEDLDVMRAVVTQVGGKGDDFVAYAQGEGRTEHDAFQASLHDQGIFGVPTYVVEDEIFFGREHLPMIRWIFEGRRGAPPDIAYDLLFE